jgi:hypothetical protein
MDVDGKIRILLPENNNKTIFRIRILLSEKRSKIFFRIRILLPEKRSKTIFRIRIVLPENSQKIFLGFSYFCLKELLNTFLVLAWKNVQNLF